MTNVKFIEPDDATVSQFIEWFEREDAQIFSHVLNWLALNEHLGQFMDSSPIESFDPIATSLVQYLQKFDPTLDFGRLQPLRLAVQKRLREEGHIERYMKYKPPQNRRPRA